MSRIVVVQDLDSQRWKVLINFIQRGPLLTDPRTANKEAQAIYEASNKDHATLKLATVTA